MGRPSAAGWVEGDAFQVRPGDHPVVLGVVAGQIVDVAGELGDCVGTQGHRLEELDAVGGHHFAKERLLVAEVGVEAFLAGLGGSGDAVDPGPGQTVLGEFGSCGCQDFATQFGARSHPGIIYRRTSSFGIVGHIRRQRTIVRS